MDIVALHSVAFIALGITGVAAGLILFFVGDNLRHIGVLTTAFIANFAGYALLGVGALALTFPTWVVIAIIGMICAPVAYFMILKKIAPSQAINKPESAIVTK